MTTTQLSPGRTRVVLIELFAGAFVMGCAEMLVVGMLDLITVDLAVSRPSPRCNVSFDRCRPRQREPAPSLSA